MGVAAGARLPPPSFPSSHRSDILQSG